MGQSNTLKTYEGSGEFYVDGRVQAEADSLTVKTSGNNSPINTFGHGLAGKSDGPRTVSIDISAAPVKNGYETDFESYVLAGGFVEVDVKSGGYLRKYIGWIEDASFSAAADGKSSLSGTFMGKPVGNVA